jgi:hypothetical protein
MKKTRCCGYVIITKEGKYYVQSNTLRRQAVHPCSFVSVSFSMAGVAHIESNYS